MTKEEDKKAKAELRAKIRYMRKIGITRKIGEEPIINPGDEIATTAFSKPLIVKSVGTKIVRAQKPGLPWIFHIRKDEITWTSPQAEDRAPVKTIKVSKRAQRLLSRPVHRKKKKSVGDIVRQAIEEDEKKAKAKKKSEEIA